ncbi:bifunctional adenosylcobinamide kinase/adenosylcobinamide-phosphate guanylyltransferase [Bacillus sp. FJAT-45350]|uniref:bifunctional adenosylcobinamide kinase/adenosylcobinamide-phosphate guanylyltransferase n=1 Tax=Bacillus sp. FJAT-45350 TaxID=2011014 RepID=UPI0015CB92CC|nr:bifunctional adenosylcobinamide kinase/adenosylcobinamide-phosphate guanylyltransferase [Bacillus sp. FJAT-45350]
MLTFVTGGVRSGKSSYAERLACKGDTGINQIHYIATSTPYDDEMKKRVKAHQHSRELGHVSWKTWEVPTYIETVFPFIHKDDVVLLDCLTNLISNELFIGWEQGEEKWRCNSFRDQLEQRLSNTFKMLQDKPNQIIIVSNELFQDIPARDKGTYFYLELLGRLHQYIVSIANKAILIQSGIPMVKK